MSHSDTTTVTSTVDNTVTSSTSAICYYCRTNNANEGHLLCTPCFRLRLSRERPCCNCHSVMVKCKPAINGNPFKRIYCTSCYKAHKAKEETIHEEEEAINAETSVLTPAVHAVEPEPMVSSTVEELKKQLEHKEKVISRMIADIHDLTERTRFFERCLYEANSRLYAIKDFSLMC